MKVIFAYDYITSKISKQRLLEIMQLSPTMTMFSVKQLQMHTTHDFSLGTAFHKP